MVVLDIPTGEPLPCSHSTHQEHPHARALRLSNFTLLDEQPKKKTKDTKLNVPGWRMDCWCYAHSVNYRRGSGAVVNHYGGQPRVPNFDPNTQGPSDRVRETPGRICKKALQQAVTAVTINEKT